jgi:hypothetical protein
MVRYKVFGFREQGDRKQNRDQLAQKTITLFSISELMPLKILPSKFSYFIA